MYDEKKILDKFDELKEKYILRYGGEYGVDTTFNEFNELYHLYNFENEKINDLIKDKIRETPCLYQFFLDYFYDDINLMKEIILKDNIYLLIAPKEVYLDNNFMTNYILNGNNLSYINFQYLENYKKIISEKIDYDALSYYALRNLMSSMRELKQSNIVKKISLQNMKYYSNLSDDVKTKIKIKYGLNNPDVLYDFRIHSKYKFRTSFLRNIEKVCYKLFKKSAYVEFNTFFSELDIDLLKNSDYLLNKTEEYSKIMNDQRYNRKEFELLIQQYNDKFSNLFELDGDRTIRNTVFRIFPKIYKVIIDNQCEKFFNLFTDFVKSDYNLSFLDIELTEENIEFVRLIANNNKDFYGIKEKYIKKLNHIFINFYNIDSEPNRRLAIISNLYINNLELIDRLDVNKLQEEDYKKLYKLGKINLNTFTDCQEMNLRNCEDLNDIENWEEEYKNKFFDSLITDLDSLKERKNAYFLKYFYMSYKEVTDIYNNLLKNLKNIKDYPNLEKFKILIEKVESCNLDEFFELCEREKQNKFDKDNIFKIMIEYNEVKKEYFKELQSNIYKPIGNSKIIELDGSQDFNLMLHVVGAYGTIPKGSIFTSWNTTNFSFNNSICCSYISNENMGVAKIKSEKNVILGFSDLPTDGLELMSSHDLYSSGFRAARSSKFLNNKELIDNTRFGHNELVVRRREGMLGEKKIQPSYVVCFDKISEISEKTADEFSVPILLINREKILQSERQKIEKSKEEFKTNYSVSAMKDIIIRAENNYAGLFMNSKRLKEKYFSLEYRQSNLDEIVKTIEQLYNEGKIEISVKLCKELAAIFKLEKEKRNINEEMASRKNPLLLNFGKVLELTHTMKYDLYEGKAKEKKKNK